jgi:hypothetical protein
MSVPGLRVYPPSIPKTLKHPRHACPTNHQQHPSYDGRMIRGASILLTAIAAATAAAFIALYLGGYAAAFGHERMALAPLIAGLGAAVLDAYRRGNLSRLTTAVGMFLLASWVVSLRFRP